MEYEGAGSFWSQLAGPQDEQLFSVVAPRKIDELLRNSSSSLLDILLDEEAISEFRSANPKMVSRITAASGIDFLLNLILCVDIPEKCSSDQKFQLPYIATELVACEIDGLLDAMTRVIPGVQTPLDRLFSVFSGQAELNPTVSGYVVRVLLVLINRRVNVVDRYLGENLGVVSEMLLDNLHDRSVADLLFRLYLDEDIRSFEMNFNELVLAVGAAENSADNFVWLIESMFGRPLIRSDDKLSIVLGQIKDDLLQKSGLALLVGKAFSLESPTVSRACLEVLSILIHFSFTRPAGTDPGNQFSSSDQGWDSFKPSVIPFASSKLISDDNDSCVYDDEEPSTSVVALKPPILGFAQSMATACLSRFSMEFFSKVKDDISHLYSFLKLLARCQKYSGETLPGSVLGTVVVESFSKYPKSTGVHNLCRDCVVDSSSGSLEEFAAVFLPATESLLGLASCRSHVDRILHFLNTTCGIALLNDAQNEAVKRWSEADSRLADRGKQPTPSSRAPSPQGVTPIIDLDMGSLSPQVRFPEDASTGAANSWSDGQVGGGSSI